MDRLKRNGVYFVCFFLVFGFMVFFKHEEQITAEEAFAIEVMHSQLRKMAQTDTASPPSQEENHDVHHDAQGVNVKNDPLQVNRAVPQEPEIYKVAPGDTLTAISQKYGIPIDKLKEINHLKDDTIFAGQVLYLREGSKEGSVD